MAANEIHNNAAQNSAIPPPTISLLPTRTASRVPATEATPTETAPAGTTEAKTREAETTEAKTTETAERREAETTEAETAAETAETETAAETAKTESAAETAKTTTEGTDRVGALAVIDQMLCRRISAAIQADDIAGTRRHSPGEDPRCRQRSGGEPFASHGPALL